MKKFVQRYLAAFLFTTLGLLALSLIEAIRFNSGMAFIRGTLFAFFIAFLITLSISLFRMRKGLDIIKIIAGLIVLMPIPILLQRLFSGTILRAGYLLLILFAVAIISYSFAAYSVRKKVEKETKELNQLLAQQNEPIDTKLNNK